MTVKQDRTINLDEDMYGSSWYEDIKYCMYCGNRLQLELIPDTPAPEPYKPDLSSLSAKDRALEDLKTEMTGEKKEYKLTFTWQPVFGYEKDNA